MDTSERVAIEVVVALRVSIDERETVTDVRIDAVAQVVLVDDDDLDVTSDRDADTVTVPKPETLNDGVVVTVGVKKLVADTVFT